MAEDRIYLVEPEGYVLETPFQKLDRLQGKEREEYVEYLRSRGHLAPTEDNVFVEAGQSFAQSLTGFGAGVGATLNEAGFGSGVQNYFQGILNRNQQWNAPEDMGAGTYIARAIGGGVGSALGTLGAGVAATAATGNPIAGAAAAGVTAFAQTFGDNVQRNRKAGYSEEKAYGMAFLESAVDSTIESTLGVVGKGTRLALNLGRIRKISNAGKRELLNRIGRKMSAELGKEEAQNLLLKWGKETAKDGLSEGFEEGLQYLNTYVNRSIGGDPDAEFSLTELADNIAQGIIAGFAMGGVANYAGVRRDEKMRIAPEDIKNSAETAPVVPDAQGAVDNGGGVTPASMPTEQPLFDTLVTEVGNALGINIDFMDNRPDGAELEKENNGFYDKENKTLYLNRNTYSVNPAETLGHELKHYIDDTDPELSKAFDALIEEGKNDAGKNEVKELAALYDNDINQGNREFSSDVFGKLFARPETWQKMAEKLDAKTPGMGEKFLQTLRDFYSLVKEKLENLVGINPEAETFLNNVNELQNEAARMLAELRRRNGTASQTENVVGAKGNTNVETVPVSQINVDAKRFQFKSNTNKASGVDDSNKLGGDWDARTAGNLYLWEDKNGKLFVVNGHHRLELAQRKGVENVNAIIDREAEGVTAEQARRNGVLINIRDGQGEVRDYASFVRDEKLSEDEAKAQGVTARQKGRSGFLLGKAGDTLYEAYRNEVIPESKAVIIAEVAQGNEAVEYAGIKLATDRKLAGETLRQTLKLAAQNSSGKKSDAEQGFLFDMVDDSVLKEWELIGKAAAKHIKEISTRIEAAKDAIKNPEAAKSLGVKTTKGAEKLLAQAQQDLMRWEHYATDSELMAQLRKEAGIEEHAETEVEKQEVAEPEKNVPQEDGNSLFGAEEEKGAPVVSAENAQTTEEDTKEESVITDTNGQEQTGTDKVEATADKSSEVEPEEIEGKKSAFEKLEDRSAELGFSFDEFYKKFTPSLNSILAKARRSFSETLGNDIENEWRTAADEALVKAYMKYPATGGKAKLKTYASKAVVNAINSVNREHKRNFKKTGGNISLDQTNEQGEKLAEMVADENASATPKKENKDLIGSYNKWKETLNPRDRKILELSEEGLPPSKIGRTVGIGMTTEGVKERLKELAAARTEGELEFSKKRGQSIQKRDATLTEVAKLNMRNEVSRVIETGIPEGKYVFKNLDDKQKTIDGAIKFLKEFSRKIVPLSDGRIAYFMPDERAFKRGSATAWAEYGIHAVTSSGKQIPGKEYNERLFNQNKLDNLDRIIPIIQQENVFGKFDNKNPAKDGVIFVGISHDGKRLEVITRLDEYGNPQADLTEVTVLATKKEANVPPLKPLSEVVEAVAQHQAAGFSPSTNDNIPQSGEKSSAELEKSRKRLHQQINPVVRDGVVRDEYADLLSNKEYTPETLEKWSRKALEWILEQGGIKPAADQLLKNHAPAEKHVATLARRMIINSDVYANAFSYEQRVKLNEQEIDDRSSWGKQGRAMQLAALKLDDVTAVQALLNKLHEKMPPEELKELRNKIMEKLGIDIYKLPDDIVNDKEKLDALLREELTHKANFKDKLYEYWINAILSGPSTHMKNLYGNTANAAYELGIKRFTEAMVNLLAGRKDGATFGEFKEMMKAFNWENVRKAITQAYQLEVLDAEGKFSEHRNIAIGGKLGRFVRLPGRALKAADAAARAIIQPMETAAYAYRMGVSEGMTGERLQMFIQKQLTTPDSKAYQWGTKRSKELTFQEDTPQFLNALMALRESDGFLGHALKVFLPFIKTPYNILAQGVRKSPLGTVSLAVDTFQRLKNKKGFDGEYIGRVAEQLIAWGTVMAIAGLSDDDDLPLVTGASAKYGSAERGFKANKLPPFSIRIGGKWFSYAGIEPFATTLAAIADSVKIYNKARNGKDGTLAMKEMLNSVGQIVVEKSYIDSVNEMIRMVQDPERELHRPITNTVASLVPNFYRQARQALVDTVPDNKSREKGMEFLKDQFIIVSNKMGVTTPMPKIDFFGREVKKDSFGETFLSPAGRLLAIRAFDADDNMDKAEKLIWDYNKKNPENQWYPDLPAAAFKLNGKKVYLAGEDYQNYAIDSGKLAHRQINNAIRAGKLKLRNPDEQDIELVKKIFSRARKETKQKYLRKAKEF